jgi:cell division septation protein DedD
VPPKPKTRITRLTSPVEEPIAEEKISAATEKESIYKSFRERNSNTNVFVIGGIIVILVVIIYFAFSMSEEPPKDVIKPSNQTAQTQPEENIVTTEPPVSNEVKEPQVNQTASAQPDNTAKVEEIRISNLIFRRGNEYNVQVSSWRSAIKADAEVKRLKAKGYNAFVVQAYLPSKGGTWHRVRIGGFKSEEQARNFLNNTQL